jgi:hypothetical protein
VFLHKQAQTSEEEKAAYVRVLHGNVLNCITTLIHEAKEFGYEFTEEHAALVELIDSFDSRNLLTFEIVDAIHELWKNSEAIAKTYERRGEFWLLEGVGYYFEHAARFTEIGYSPSEQDIVMARKRTTGVVETSLSYGNVSWSVVDVGGQRSERRKWLNCFENVKGILYAVNLAGYCSVLFEDRAVNRMQESLKLFEETMANPLFADTPVFLILNKKDLVREHITRISPSPQRILRLFTHRRRPLPVCVVWSLSPVRESDRDEATDDCIPGVHRPTGVACMHRVYCESVRIEVEAHTSETDGAAHGGASQEGCTILLRVSRTICTIPPRSRAIA